MGILEMANGIAGLINLGLLVIMYRYVQSREDKMRSEYKAKCAKLQEDLTRVDKENDDLRTNYRDRFEKVYEGLSEIKIAIAQLQMIVKGAS